MIINLDCFQIIYRHNYIKVSSLRSSTNFKKGIFSKTLYKLIYFCLIGKNRRFYYKKIPTIYFKTIFKRFANFFGEYTLFEKLREKQGAIQAGNMFLGDLSRTKRTGVLGGRARIVKAQSFELFV